MRLKWGCDAPAIDGGGYGIPCRSCDGRNRACTRCKGIGSERIIRCPAWHLRRKGVDEVMRAWAWMKAHGHLPVAGGMMDQSRCFVQASQLLEAATSRHKDREAAKTRG